MRISRPPWTPTEASASRGRGEAAKPFVLHNTGSVALDPNGNFTIVDTLDPVPSECPSPVLLIRSNGSGVWFAAGIPKLTGE